jgi:hypothetical protein
MDKDNNIFFKKDVGKKVVETSWNGAKMVGFAILAGAALGLGLGAMDSVGN